MEYLSLTVGDNLKLDVPFEATYQSDNVRVTVTNDGIISASEDALYPNGIANITASEINGTQQKQFQVTIVPWSANRVKLSLVKTLDARYNITRDGNRLLAGVRGGTALYETYDNFKTMSKLSDIPGKFLWSPILVTPNGYFLHGEYHIYMSKDLITWTTVLTKWSNALMHMFDFTHDPVTGNVYIYTGDYQVDPAVRCKVFRGTFKPDGTYNWATLKEFYSRNQLTADPSLAPHGCWHVHATIIDKQTGDLWVGTGDYNNPSECSIWRVTNPSSANNWEVVGYGNQDWRTLSIWFTQGYVYFNNDTHEPQKVWRLRREWLGVKTPEQMHMDKEMVADLKGGSQWFHIWAKDAEGENVVLMNTAVEGKQRDLNSRIFMFKETPTGVEVDEVLVMPSDDPTVGTSFSQMEVYAQDAQGYIYATGRAVTPYLTYVYRFGSDTEIPEVPEKKLRIKAPFAHPYGGTLLKSTRTLLLSAEDENGNVLDNNTLTWSVSDPFVASIDSKGYLTVVKSGLIYVTAINPDGILSNKVWVTIMSKNAMNVGLARVWLNNLEGITIPVYNPDNHFGENTSFRIATPMGKRAFKLVNERVGNSPQIKVSTHQGLKFIKLYE